MAVGCGRSSVKVSKQYRVLIDIHSDYLSGEMISQHALREAPGRVAVVEGDHGVHAGDGRQATGGAMLGLGRAIALS